VHGVEVTGHQERKTSAETGAHVRSYQKARRRKVRRKVFQHFAGQYVLNDSSVQLCQARNGHLGFDYTTADHNGCTAPDVGLCAVECIIANPGVLTIVKECLT